MVERRALQNLPRKMRNLFILIKIPPLPKKSVLKNE